MHYTQLFRSLREAKGLTLEGLAKLARCHRNTVINVESGRPVKFKTIADLMKKMGYTALSDELKSLALLWLEATSGIPFSRKKTEISARKTITSYRTAVGQATRRLELEARQANLTVEQVNLLIFALHHPEMLSILENIRDLVTTLEAEPVSDGPQLKVAEDET
ncbi:MAG TPA: helix-turn-helix transcriptional regulator [Rariglobus sp.]|jgi:transcriptional regulator with XRE-family HTH domain|nr:helix-turn-helix transcriptional regulator [Rariglobus sp.]